MDRWNVELGKCLRLVREIRGGIDFHEASKEGLTENEILKRELVQAQIDRHKALCLARKFGDECKQLRENLQIWRAGSPLESLTSKTSAFSDEDPPTSNDTISLEHKLHRIKADKDAEIAQLRKELQELANENKSLRSEVKELEGCKMQIIKLQQKVRECEAATADATKQLRDSKRTSLTKSTQPQVRTVRTGTSPRKQALIPDSPTQSPTRNTRTSSSTTTTTHGAPEKFAQIHLASPPTVANTTLANLNAAVGGAKVQNGEVFQVKKRNNSSAGSRLVASNAAVTGATSDSEEESSSYRIKPTSHTIESEVAENHDMVFCLREARLFAIDPKQLRFFIVVKHKGSQVARSEKMDELFNVQVDQMIMITGTDEYDTDLNLVVEVWETQTNQKDVCIAHSVIALNADTIYDSWFELNQSNFVHLLGCPAAAVSDFASPIGPDELCTFITTQIGKECPSDMFDEDGRSVTCESYSTWLALSQLQEKLAKVQQKRWETFFGGNSAITGDDLANMLWAGIPSTERAVMFVSYAENHSTFALGEDPAYYATQLTNTIRILGSHGYREFEDIASQALQVVNHIAARSPILQSDQGIRCVQNVLATYLSVTPNATHKPFVAIIAAQLLYVVEDELEAVKLTFYLCDKILEGFFSPSSEPFLVAMCTVESLLWMRLPNEMTKLESLGIHVTDITSEWTCALFVPFLPLACVLRIMDVLMYEGKEVVYATVLALFRLVSKPLLECTLRPTADLLLRDFFRNFPDVGLLMHTVRSEFAAIVDEIAGVEVRVKEYISTLPPDNDLMQTHSARNNSDNSDAESVDDFKPRINSMHQARMSSDEEVPGTLPRVMNLP